MKIKALLLCIVCGIGLVTKPAHSETFTLQDIIKATAPLPGAINYVAKEVVTLDPNKPMVTAVAVVDNRILATGTLERSQKMRFPDSIIFNGLWPLKMPALACTGSVSALSGRKPTHKQNSGQESINSWSKVNSCQRTTADNMTITNPRVAAVSPLCSSI
ncbi:MAG: hypothetical protein PVG22_16325 [Chromatiales bacterium]|jgi:hypothetical protein